MAIPISKAKARLTAQVTPSSTTISFTPTDTNRSLTSVVMGDFGSSGYVIINPGGNVGNYEIVKFTGWSVASGVITISGLTRNLVLQGSDSGQTGLTFSAGTTVIVGDNHHWWNQIANTGVQATTSVAGTVEIGTNAENAAGTSTGGSGALIVAASSSHSTTPGSNIIPVANTSSVLDQGWVDITCTAGETIDASTTPKAVYLKESDGKVYKAVATSGAAALYRFIGFVGASQNVSADATVRVRVRGTMAGFGGTLTDGADHFITDTAGGISTTAGTVKFRAGIATSTSTLLIKPDNPCATGVFQSTSTETVTKTVGFRVNKITVFANLDGASSFWSNGCWSNNGGNYCVYITSTASGGFASDIFHVETDVANKLVGDITNVTSTSFDFNIVQTGAIGDVNIVWMAFGEN